MITKHNWPEPQTVNSGISIMFMMRHRHIVLAFLNIVEWLIDVPNVNKNVSYRKQIARQHSCHKFLARARGVDDSVNIFLSSSLITVQNLVTVSHTVCTHVGGPTNMGALRLRSVPLGQGWLLETRPSPTYHAECGRSKSNGTTVGLRTDIRRENEPIAFRLSRSFKVTGTDTDRSMTSY